MGGAWLVTGASRGIGRSIAKVIAASGAPVIALARDSADLDIVCEELGALHSESVVISCDLACSTDIANAAAAIISNFDHIDGVVHNAGTIVPIKPMLEVESEEWSRLIQVNLIGVQELTRRLSSHIGGSARTRITCISSGASISAIHSWSAYCVSKAGLDMWSLCMAEEGKSRNISSVSIAPGIVNTRMQKDIRETTPEDFPMHQRFTGFYEDGDLSDPDYVAQKLRGVILEQTMEMSGQRLDIREM